MTSDVAFDLSTVFATVAGAIPDRTLLMWRNKRLTYAQVDSRVDGIARYLVSCGLGCHTDRRHLQGHESGQDHLGLYLRNGNQYLEAMIASYRARVAPFNVNYRYVEEELAYLLSDAHTRAIVYAAEFAPQVAAVRDRLPECEVLIQVADHSCNGLLPGAIDYESITATAAPAGGMPKPSGDDLYVLYTGGTTGMPKGVLWRQHDIFMSAMGGRAMGTGEPLRSHAELAERVVVSGGGLSLLMLPPLMHGAAQWAAYNIMTMGGSIVIPDSVDRLRPAEVLELVEREKVMSIATVGDAIARPLVEAIEAGDYDLSSLLTVSNGGAALTPTVRGRLHAALPHALLFDAVGSSETGFQMNMVSSGAETRAATFTPQGDTTVISLDFDRVLGPGEGQGWLARRDFVPLGYLGDADKTARTFPTIDGVRWSVPGDRAAILPDGRIELLGRDSVTINSGGEKIFAEEVERAVAAHPHVYDVVVTGRPSERWGSEVVAIIQLAEGRSATDEELLEVCKGVIATYKLPKAFVRTSKVMRSPVGKPDYRWAKQIAEQSTSTSAT